MDPKTNHLLKKPVGTKSVRESILKPDVAPHDVMGTFTENLSYLNDVVVTNQLSANQQVKLNYQDPNLINKAAPNMVVVRTAPNGSALANKAGDRSVISKPQKAL